ncbi:MAG: hypothetical protein RSE94_16230, partial [Pseudomonas sp.]
VKEIKKQKWLNLLGLIFLQIYRSSKQRLTFRSIDGRPQQRPTVVGRALSYGGGSTFRKRPGFWVQIQRRQH